LSTAAQTAIEIIIDASGTPNSNQCHTSTWPNRWKRSASPHLVRMSRTLF